MPHEAKENLLFFSIDKTLRMALPFTYVSVYYSKYKTEGDKIEIYQYKILISFLVFLRMNFFWSDRSSCKQLPVYVKDSRRPLFNASKRLLNKSQYKYL